MKSELNYKTKVLFWAQLPPPLHGASLRNASIFESNLIRENFNIIYIKFNYSQTISELGKPSIRKMFLFFSLYVKLFIRCFKRDFDMVYFTYSLRKMGVIRDALFVALFRLFKIPIIFHFRNQGAKELAKSKLMSVLLKFSFKEGHFICLSKTAINDVNEFIDIKNTFVVNNGIKTINYKVRKKNKFNPVKLFFISNLRYEKGVYVLLEVYKKLQLFLNDKISLSIVGQEGDISYSEISNYIKENSINNIQLLGPLYGEKKNEIFKNSDIFIFPTRNEVFPGVILEAMQFGLPVVTTKVGSIPDIIETNVNGILCDVDDVNQMVSSILKLIRDKSFFEMIRYNAKSDFEDNYTLESFEKNMCETLKFIERSL